MLKRNSCNQDLTELGSVKKVCYSLILQVSRFFSLSETQCLGMENQYQRFQATAHPVAIKNLITFASHPIKDRLINGNTLNGSGNFFNGNLHLLM